MKRILLLAIIVSANLYATQEIKLEDTHIKRSSDYYGSIVGNEKKNMIIIDKEEIEKKQYADIVSIFNDSPVTMVTYTQAGPLIALRGSGEKTIMRVNILLNGMSINTMDESMGVIPFNAIPVSSIERIEIIPGGGVTLYGSGSSSGIINIVTNKNNKNSYGAIHLNASSYDTYNVQASKGIKLGDKVFLDLAIEGKKAQGYREREKNKKLNVIAGVDYKLNDRHKFRIEGTKFIADDNSTEELSYKELSKNRRGAGKSDVEVDSDRDSFTTRYEYTPNQKWTVSAAYNQSEFTRDVKQNNKPYLTFLPSEGFNDFFGKPDGWEADLVLLDVYNDLEGSIREKNKNFKFKTDYKYNRGNFIFGYDKSKHELNRKMNINVHSFDPNKQLRYLLRPAWETVLDEEVLDKRGKNYIMDVNFDLFTMGTAFQASGISQTNSKRYFRDVYHKLLDEYVDVMEEGINNPEKNKKLKEVLREGDYNNLVSSIQNLKIILKDAETNPAALDDYEVAKNVFWKLSDELSKEKLSKFIVPGTTQLTLYGATIDIEPDMTVGEYVKKLKSAFGMGFEEGLVSQASITNSWVDVKKDTDAFYLYNDFNITEKLNLDAGIRYERARYKGIRHTDSRQIISVKEPWDANASAAADLVGRLTGLAEANIKGETTHNWSNKESEIKMQELEEKGTTIIPMVNIDIENKNTETNIGGHVGLTYKFNDTDSIYGRYERGFNSPLPTQFTNKTVDPRTKIKAYWESHIKSETIDNFELGIKGMIGDHTTYSIAGFLSNTHNEILSVVKNGSSHMLREWRYINLKRTRRMGVELQSQQIFDKLRLKESFTYIDPKILSDDLERSTRDIYEDILRISEKEHLKWHQNALNSYYLGTNLNHNINNVTLEDRKAMALQINEVYENMVNKEIDLKTSKEQVNNIIEKYKNQYVSAGINTRRFFTTLSKEVLGNDGSLHRIAKHREHMSSYYKNQLDGSIKGKFLKKGDQIPLTPKYKATFGADYQLTEKFNVGTNVTYIGSFTNAEPVNGYGIKTTKVPHHLVADLYATYHMNSSTEIKLGINNVFNHKYYLRQDSKTATPAPGRTCSLGLSYRF